MILIQKNFLNEIKRIQLLTALTKHCIKLGIEPEIAIIDVNEDDGELTDAQRTYFMVVDTFIKLRNFQKQTLIREESHSKVQSESKSKLLLEKTSEYID